MNAEEFVFQSFGKPSKFSNTVLRPDAAKSSTGILCVFVSPGLARRSGARSPQ